MPTLAEIPEVAHLLATLQTAKPMTHGLSRSSRAWPPTSTTPTGSPKTAIHSNGAHFAGTGEARNVTSSHLHCSGRGP